MSGNRYGDHNIEGKVWDYHFGDIDEGLDVFGHEIHWDDYRENTDYGWNIDHIWPKNPLTSNRKGSDYLTNLQPLCNYCNEEKANRMSGKIDGQHFGIEPAGEREGKMVGRIKLF